MPEYSTLKKVEEVISSWEMTLSWRVLNHFEQIKHLTDLGFKLAHLVENCKIKMLDLRNELSEYFNFEEINTGSLSSAKSFAFERKPEQAYSDMNTSLF